MNIDIRKATIADLQTIQRLNQKLCTKENADFDCTVNPNFPNTQGGENYFRKSIQDDNYIALIAENENEVLGYLVGSIEKVGDFRNIPSFGEVGDMLVEEKYRGQGVGGKLIGEFKKWCLEKGISRIRVIASFDNKKAIEFYKREGFKEYDLILEGDLV